MTQAPVILVVFVNPEETVSHYGERGRNLYIIQDSAAAAENIFLSVIALGLSTCWVGAFNEKGVKNILNLKTNERPMVIMPVGYP